MKNSWKELKHEDLSKFLSELADAAELWVPMYKDDRWYFDVFDKNRKVVFPKSIIDISAKGLFFPKRRPVAQFTDDHKWSLEPVQTTSHPRIIMGMHPCDVSSLLYMDQVFLDAEHKDMLYQAERKRTLIIGLFCEEMSDTCHCTDRGMTPDNTTGMDIVFVNTGRSYLFQVITDKGKAIFNSELLRETDKTPLKRTWPKDRFPVASPEDLLKLYTDQIWDDLSDICLTCGICTYSCPTCICFRIADEKFRGKGQRITTWDSCQFSSYSRMAGGHNSRKRISSRVRNRILDKFAYSYQRYGRISCTGCGRCVIKCPLKRSFPQTAVIINSYIKDKKTAVSKTKEEV